MLGEILNRDVTVWEFFGATFEIFKVSKNLGATVTHAVTSLHK
jgi:hypothetical protein